MKGIIRQLATQERFLSLWTEQYQFGYDYYFTQGDIINDFMSSKINLFPVKNIINAGPVRLDNHFKNKNL